MKVEIVLNTQISSELCSLLKRTLENDVVRKFKACTFIPIGFEFNSVYYYHNDNELMAFKILCCSYHFSVISWECGWEFLIEFPNGELKWVLNFHKDKVFFDSTDDFFEYLNGNKLCGFKIETRTLSTINNLDPSTYYCKRHTWKWSERLSKPCAEESIIKYAIYNENGITLVLSKDDDEFFTEEECVAKKLNNMKIVQFNNNPTFSINISIEKKSEPIIRTLQFIEK